MPDTQAFGVDDFLILLVFLFVVILVMVIGDLVVVLRFDFLLLKEKLDFEVDFPFDRLGLFCFVNIASLNRSLKRVVCSYDSLKYTLYYFITLIATTKNARFANLLNFFFTRNISIDHYKLRKLWKYFPIIIAVLYRK